MNDERTQREDFMDDDAESTQEGRAGRDKQAKRDKKSGKIPDRRKRIPPHGDRCDPELKGKRYRRNAGQPRSPYWAIEAGFGNLQEQFSQEELRQFRGMAIELGRRFLGLATAFETYLAVGMACNAGTASLKEISESLEQKQKEGTYPKELPVSVASLHRAVVQVEEFFRSHFKLKITPRLVWRLGDGLPVRQLTAAGNVAWELIRTHLVAMGYDDVWDSPQSS